MDKSLVTEQWQEIISNTLKEILSLTPEYVQNYFVSNILQRTLAHQVGQTDLGAVLLKATNAGALITAPVGTGYTHNETIAKFTCGDTYTEKSFSQVVSRIDIITWDYGIIFKRKPTADSVYEGEVEIPKDTWYSFDCCSLYISIKNAVAGSNAACQVVGWY